VTAFGIPELVTERAESDGEAVAVYWGGQVLRYRELEQRANKLANYLRESGVSRDTPVGILSERSPDLIIAALAVMRAGGAYLPLDPSYPSERLKFMIEDSRAPLLLCGGSVPPGGDLGSCRVVRLDWESDPLATASGQPPLGRGDPDDLAYVIYTSGSTGAPKGVGVTHRSLLNLVRWHRRAFAVGERDRASQLASPGFDAAVWEIWPYLTAGASLSIPDDLTRLDPARLRDWLIAQRVTIGFVPTPVAEALIGLPWPAEGPLRTLLTGGDVLHIFPPASLPFSVINNYGPTEATVVATSGVVPTDGGAFALPAIGHAIDGVEVHVVDERLQQVANGGTGELLVGGIGLARGYLYRDDLTEERFISNPFNGPSGTRLYRTGDLVRVHAGGEFEFLGRVDEQVKIRGQRVELGEIAAALDRHHSVSSSVVVAIDDSVLGRRLVAYIVGAHRGAIAGEMLREHLARTLPAHMLPGEFICIPEMPMTANGKVDRAALPQATRSPLAVRKGGRRPTSPVEQVLAQMVADLLELETVDTDENFFNLGGHSLLGAQLIARVSELYRVELPLRTVFDGPTVGEIAAAVEASLLAEVSALSEDEAIRLLGVERIAPQSLDAVSAQASH
jgi:amino acid adenylation domain-containing protein